MEMARGEVDLNQVGLDLAFGCQRRAITPNPLIKTGYDVRPIGDEKTSTRRFPFYVG